MQLGSSRLAERKYDQVERNNRDTFHWNEGEKTKDERTDKWDILKALLIFCVVLGHFADFYTPESVGMRKVFMCIYTFHMPLFLFVSGMFSKRVIRERDKGRLLGWFSMYLFIKCIFWIHQVIEEGDYDFKLFSETTVPWFMLAMVFFSIITMFLEGFSSYYVMIMWVVMSCVAGYDLRIGDDFVLSRIIVFFPFWYAGYSIDRRKLEKNCRNKYWKMIAGCIIILFVIFVYIQGERIYELRPILTGRNGFKELGKNMQYGFLIRLMYYLVVTVIGYSIIVLIPEKTPFKYIVQIGRRTLSIYALHYPLLWLFYERLEVGEWFEKNIPEFDKVWVFPAAVFVVLFLSIPVFERITRCIMEVPRKKG